MIQSNVEVLLASSSLLVCILPFKKKKSLQKFCELYIYIDLNGMQ